jgi:hypothetical protein
MPRFFIHSRCGRKIVRDLEGQDLPGLEAAQAAATASVRELLADEIKRPSRHLLDAMIIADESGKELMTIRAKDVLPEPLK